MLRRFWLIVVLTGFAIAPAKAQSPNPSFNIVNRTANAINEVYATTAGATTWGRDRLGNRSIPPGQAGPIRLPADGNCVYDVRVVYANGQSEERRGLNTCSVDNVFFPATGSRTTTPGGRQPATNDPSFRLVNRGRSAVNELYASLPGADDWGEDRLGGDTVAPGATRVVRLPSGQCLYDMRIVYANGEANEKRRVSLCGVTNLPVP